MATKLTDALVRDAKPKAGTVRHEVELSGATVVSATTVAPGPVKTIIWDTVVPGFGLRITPGGVKAFIFNYRVRGSRLDRQYKIAAAGSDGGWPVSAARQEAKKLRHEVDGGGDPVGREKAGREEETFGELWDDFKERHLPKLRATTRRDYIAVIEKYVLPKLTSRKVEDIGVDDVDRVIRKIAAPHQANRARAVLSKMFSLAGPRLKLPVNPVKGVTLNPVEKRERYLTPDEIGRLREALREHNDFPAQAILALLLETGARRNEVQAMRWEDVDFAGGNWTKPSSHTKQKKLHHVPLRADALTILRVLRVEAEMAAAAAGKPLSPFVFPGPGVTGHRVEIKNNWRSICKAAGLWGPRTVKSRKGKADRIEMGPTARIHDLRHTFASLLASIGQSLPMIGRLLGHTQAATTLRYAHLAVDPLRVAAESIGPLSIKPDLLPRSRGPVDDR